MGSICGLKEVYGWGVCPAFTLLQMKGMSNSVNIEATCDVV